MPQGAAGHAAFCATADRTLEAAEVGAVRQGAGGRLGGGDDAVGAAQRMRRRALRLHLDSSAVASPLPHQGGDPTRRR